MGAYGSAKAPPEAAKASPGAPGEGGVSAAARPVSGRGNLEVPYLDRRAILNRRARVGEQSLKPGHALRAKRGGG